MNFWFRILKCICLWLTITKSYNRANISNWEFQKFTGFSPKSFPSLCFVLKETGFYYLEHFLLPRSQNAVGNSRVFSLRIDPTSDFFVSLRAGFIEMFTFCLSATYDLRNNEQIWLFVTSHLNITLGVPTQSWFWHCVQIWLRIWYLVWLHFQSKTPSTK